MNNTVNVFSQKTRKTICIFMSIVFFVMSALVLWFFLCASIIIRGRTLNIRSFIEWILDVVNISGSTVMYYGVRAVLTMVYVAIVAVCVVKLINSAVLCVRMFFKNTVENKPAEYASFIYGNTQFVLMLIFGYIFSATVLYPSSVNKTLYICLLVFIPLIALLGRLRDIVYIDQKKRLWYTVSDAIETIFLMVIIFMIMNMISSPAISELVRGFSKIGAMSGAPVNMMLTGIKVWLVNPVITIILAITCLVALCNVFESPYEIDHLRNRSRLTWIVMTVWAGIGYFVCCFIDGFNAYKVGQSSKEFWDMLRAWFESGREFYLPVLLLSVAGLVAVVAKPMKFKTKKAESDSDQLDVGEAQPASGEEEIEE